MTNLFHFVYHTVGVLLVSAINTTATRPSRAMKLTLLSLAAVAMPAHPDTLDAPGVEVRLTVQGNIANTTAAGEARLDLAQLQALGSTTIETNTPWTKGKTRFTGVRLKTLYEHLGIPENASVKAYAFDDYSIKLPDVDLDKYPVIIAWSRNDKTMSLRDMGPLWMMFPFDDFPKLLTEQNKAACIWQLYRLEVQ